MPLSPLSIIDRWIARSARPNPQAVAAVSGLAPATVVSGASRGIGRALAARFAAAGRDVVMIARSRTELEQAASQLRTHAAGRVLALALDVTRHDAPELIDQFLAANGAYLDVLVNNAATGLAGSFDTSSAEDIDGLLALNIGALTRLMRHALPAMKARGRGGVLNVASLAGAIPGPYQAAYYASKAYVISLTEAVAAECGGSGVRIAVVVPGPVATGFHAAMGAENALYRRLLPANSPEPVARSAYAGFMLGRRVIYPGVLAPLAVAALRILPHPVTVPVVAWLLNIRPPPERR